MSQVPDLEYQQFWGELAEEMGRGAKGAHRDEWKRVKPEYPLTVESWRAFRKKFELAMSKVEDRSEQEERELLFGHLTAEWQQKVMEEDSRRCDRATKWVKVTQLPPMGEEEV